MFTLRAGNCNADVSIFLTAKAPQCAFFWCSTPHSFSSLPQRSESSLVCSHFCQCREHLNDHSGIEHWLHPSRHTESHTKRIWWLILVGGLVTFSTCWYYAIFPLPHPLDLANLPSSDWLLEDRVTAVFFCSLVSVQPAEHTMMGDTSLSISGEKSSIAKCVHGRDSILGRMH